MDIHKEIVVSPLRRTTSKHSCICENSKSILLYFGKTNFENYLPVFPEIYTKMTNEDGTQMSVPTCNICDYTFTGQFGCEKAYIFTLYIVIFHGEMGTYMSNFCSHWYPCSSLNVCFCCPIVSCFDYENPACRRASTPIIPGVRALYGVILAMLLRYKGSSLPAK